VKQFQPLRSYLRSQVGHAGDIAARSAQAFDEAEPDRIAAYFEDDRNGRGRRLCCERRRSSGRGNHCHLTINEVGCHFRQPISSTLGPTVIDRNVLTIDIAGFLQALTECSRHGPVSVSRGDIEECDHRHR